MKNKKKETEVEVKESALSDAEIDDLLAAVEDNNKELKEAFKEEAPSITEEVKKEVNKLPELKKAYNIYQDPNTRMYILDTVEYGDGKVTVTTKDLTINQAMALYEAKKIFTEKLILKRGGR